MPLTPVEKHQMMALLNHNDPAKRAEGHRIYLELDAREFRLRKEHLDLTELQKEVTLNHPENPLAYLPALVLLLSCFSLIVWALS